MSLRSRGISQGTEDYFRVNASSGRVLNTFMIPLSVMEGKLLFDDGS